MAEFYDYTDSKYYKLLKRSVRVYKWKLELLDYQDATIREIVIDLDTSNVGSINFTSEQGTCRSCSFTFTNPDYRYSIIENNPFWDRRRFKLYLGLVGDGDEYWFSKGVYITQQANVDYHTITVQAVDKYGLLDGTLNVSPIFLKTTFEVGSKIGDVVRQILLQDIGNGMLLDATEPIIDPDIANTRLYKEFELGVGTYYGEFFNEIMTSYGCDIYYDNLGRLVINRRFNDDLPYWFYHLGMSYTFSDKEIHYQEPGNSYEFNGANYVTVETDNTFSENATYTAINHNPESPICVEKVGYKAYDNGNPIVISSGDDTIDTPLRKCKEYAEYVLLQNTCITITKSFNCPILPHLDTRQAIRVTDDPMIEDGVVYYISSLSFPFGAANDMSVTGTNIQWLQTDTESTSLTCEVGNNATAKFTVTYGGTIKDSDGNDVTINSISDYAGGAVILNSSGYVATSYGRCDLGYFNADKIMTGWQDNQYGDEHNVGSLYTIPEQDVTMTPVWETQQKAVIKRTNLASGSRTQYSPAISSNTAIPEVAYFKDSGKYSNQAFVSGNRTYSYSLANAGAMEIDFLYPTGYTTTLAGLASAISTDYNNITEIDLSGMGSVVSMTSPLSGLSQNSNTIVFKFPPNVTSISGNNWFSNCKKLNITWPTAQCTLTGSSIFYNAGNNNDMLDTLTIPSNISISAGAGFFSNFKMAKQLILACDISPSSGTAFQFAVGAYIEDLQLLGTIHFSQLQLSSASALQNLVVGQNVTIDEFNDSAQLSLNNLTCDLEYDSNKFTTLNNCINGFNGESLVIGATAINTIISCFKYLGSNHTSFTVPSSVKTITNCFQSSSYLTTLDLGSNTEDISGVDKLAALTSLTFGNKVKTITDCFVDQTFVEQVASITLPASLTSISGSFTKRPTLTSLTIGSDGTPSSATSISNSFNTCNYLETIEFDSNDTATFTIADSFKATRKALNSLTLPVNVTSITNSFNYGNLTSLVLPDSVVTCTGSFRNMSLTSLYIGAGLTNMDFTTQYFSSLTSITVSENNTAFKSIDDVALYSYDGTTVRLCVSGQQSITIADGTQTIAAYAIGNYTLDELSIPSSVTFIASNGIRSSCTIGVLEILNPSMPTYNLPYSNVSKIRGYAGSTAETFANSKGITFEAIT